MCRVDRVSDDPDSLAGLLCRRPDQRPLGAQLPLEAADAYGRLPTDLRLSQLRSRTAATRRVRPIDAGPKPQHSPTQTEARRRRCPGRNGQGRRQSRGADLGWVPRVTISFSLDANENDKSSPKSQSWRSLISMAQRSARPLALILAAPRAARFDDASDFFRFSAASPWKGSIHGWKRRAFSLLNAC